MDDPARAVSTPNDRGARAAALLAAAGAMIPVVAERARACEDRRRLPEATEEAFRDAGFYRVLQPARFGGLELDYGIQTDLAAEIGRGCASSAWNLSVIAAHGWILGMFPREAQEEIWGKTPDATISTSFLPLDATVERVSDGLRIRGSWGFSSGADYCAAAILLVMVEPPGGGAREAAFVLLPRSAYEVRDTWHATGLAGTGSNTIVVAGTVVPEHRVLFIRDTRGGSTPGSAANPGPLYRIPLYAAFPFNLVGAALGAARGALDDMVSGLAGRSSAMHIALQAQQSVHLRIANVAALVNAARDALAPIRDEINRIARDGGVPSLQRKLDYRIALSHSARQCVQAVDELFPLLGGRGLAVGDPMQRAWRDVHAVAQHIGLVWDVQAGLYGAVRLGLPCPDPKL